MLPELRSTQEWVWPAVSWTASLTPGSISGPCKSRCSLPSWRRSLLPQHCTSPPSSSAQLCSCPRAMPMAPDTPSTGRGKRLRLPWAPSWPCLLLPQHSTLPSRSSAQLWSPPAATWRAPLRPATSAPEGSFLPARGRPSLPSTSSPQHQTRPPPSTPQPWLLPASIWDVEAPAVDVAPFVEGARVLGTGDDLCERHEAVDGEHAAAQHDPICAPAHRAPRIVAHAAGERLADVDGARVAQARDGLEPIVAATVTGIGDATPTIDLAGLAHRAGEAVAGGDVDVALAWAVAAALRRRWPAGAGRR